MKQRLWRSVTALLLIGLLLVLTACGGTADEPLLLLDPDPADIGAPSGGTEAERLTDFGVRLMQAAAQPGTNLLLSPRSVEMALALTAQGADGETLDQMTAVLGMDPAAIAKALAVEPGDPCLHLANGIWFTDDDRFTVREDLTNRSRRDFGAEVRRAAFDRQTCREINRWAERETRGMIPNILEEIPEEAVMVLVNALAFAGQWADPYDAPQVRQGTFTAWDGTARQTDFLHSEEYTLLTCPNAQGFMKPYQGGRYAFAALLPDEGVTVETLWQSLDGPALHRLLRNGQPAAVSAAIPKFTVDCGAELVPLLSAMGMPLAFDHERADFSRLGSSTAGNIFISSVLHRTFLSLGEQGTRAGAATVVEACDEAAMEPEQVYEIRLDRPFLYLLLDMDTGVPFFLGTMADPG